MNISNEEGAILGLMNNRELKIFFMLTSVVLYACKRIFILYLIPTKNFSIAFNSRGSGMLYYVMELYMKFHFLCQPAIFPYATHSTHIFYTLRQATINQVTKKAFPGKEKSFSFAVDGIFFWYLHLIVC